MPGSNYCRADCTKYQIPVILLCDTNHVLESSYSQVVTVGAGTDAVDFKLVSICKRGDIVVTQDYGVAAMILGKVLMVFIRVENGTQMKHRSDVNGTPFGKKSEKYKKTTASKRTCKKNGVG